MTKQRIRQREIQEADWSAADGQLLHQLIIVIARMGGAVRFGHSRDGGAFSIGIYGDGEPYTEYVGGGGDINHHLQSFIETYRDL